MKKMTVFIILMGMIFHPAYAQPLFLKPASSNPISVNSHPPLIFSFDAFNTISNQLSLSTSTYHKNKIINLLPSISEQTLVWRDFHLNKNMRVNAKPESSDLENKKFETKTPIYSPNSLGNNSYWWFKQGADLSQQKQVNDFADLLGQKVPAILRTTVNKNFDEVLVDSSIAGTPGPQGFEETFFAPYEDTATERTQNQPPTLHMMVLGLIMFAMALVRSKDRIEQHCAPKLCMN